MLAQGAYQEECLELIQERTKVGTGMVTSCNKGRFRS